MIQLNKPQADLIKLLVYHKVIFLVIGGHAVLEYVNYRTTSDLDILLSRSRGNASKLAKVFESNNWQAPIGKKWIDALTQPRVRLAYPADVNKEADLLTSIDGIDFGKCYEKSVLVKFEKLELRIPSLLDLIEMKKCSMVSGNDKNAQEKDAIDIKELQKKVAN